MPVSSLQHSDTDVMNQRTSEHKCGEAGVLDDEYAKTRTASNVLDNGRDGVGALDTVETVTGTCLR